MDTKKKVGGKDSNFGISGRALFLNDPSLFVDDEDAGDENIYE
jgi:hypothetical protein